MVVDDGSTEERRARRRSRAFGKTMKGQSQMQNLYEQLAGMGNPLACLGGVGIAQFSPMPTKLQKAKQYAAEVRKRKGWTVKRLSA